MMSVTVDAGTETVIVTGASVKIYVAVMISIVVSLRTGGKGATVPAGDSTEDIEDGGIMSGSTEKRIPSIVVIAETTVLKMPNGLTFAGGVEFPIGVN